MDIYSTRAQLAAIELLPPEYSFMYDLFCADMGAVEDDKAIYDFRKGRESLRPQRIRKKSEEREDTASYKGPHDF